MPPRSTAGAAALHYGATTNSRDSGAPDVANATVPPSASRPSSYLPPSSPRRSAAAHSSAPASSESQLAPSTSTSSSSSTQRKQPTSPWDGRDEQSGPSSSSIAADTSASAGKAKSCRECIRLKLKCSRSPWPCDKCVQRGTASLCPDGQLATRPYKRVKPTNSSIAAEAAATASISPDPDDTTDAAVSQQQRAAQSRPRRASPILDRRTSSDDTQTSRLNTQSPPTLMSRQRGSNANSDVQTRSSKRRSDGEASNARQRSASPRSAVSMAATNEHGSLHLGREGRSTRYIGPGGHSFSLAEDSNDMEDALYTRPASPVNWSGDPSSSLAQVGSNSHLRQLPQDGLGQTQSFQPGRREEAGPTALLQADVLSAFLTQPAALVPTPGVRSPFSHRAVVTELSKHLPAAEQARRAFLVYIWNVSWMYDPVHQLRQLWESFYPQDPLGPIADFPPPDQDDEATPTGRNAPTARKKSGHRHHSSSSVAHPHRLALIFSVLSLGVLFDVAPGAKESGAAEHFYQCSWAALSFSNLNNHNSIESVQTIHLIGQYLCNRKSGRNADSFYPLIGYAVRSAVSMGLHRDAQAWNLSKKELQERRRLFWELFACDAFRSLAYGRPCNIQDHHTNAIYPGHRPNRPLSDHFHTSKFHVVRLLNRIIDTCYGADVPYSVILDLDKELRQLWSTKLPSELGTQRWSTLQGSSFNDASMNLDDVESLRELHIQLQAHTIAANIHQTFLHLHRPWFLKAIRSNEHADLFHSPYIRSVIAVSESSRTLISIGASISQKAFLVSARWNFFWQHVFNAGVCQCLHVLYSPHGISAVSAWEDVGRAVALLQYVRSDRSDVIWAGKLKLLDRMRNQAAIQLSGSKKPADQSEVEARLNGASDQLHLIGATSTFDWRSRRGDEAGRGANNQARSSGPGTGATSPGGTNQIGQQPLSPGSRQFSGTRVQGAGGAGVHAMNARMPASDVPQFPEGTASFMDEGDASMQGLPGQPGSSFSLNPIVGMPLPDPEGTSLSSLLDWASYDGGSNLADLLQVGSEPDVRFWEQFTASLPGSNRGGDPPTGGQSDSMETSPWEQAVMGSSPTGLPFGPGPGPGQQPQTQMQTQRQHHQQQSQN
ncbi:unnamed protein product [Jaminaea pallidilutea]